MWGWMRLHWNCLRNEKKGLAYHAVYWMIGQDEVTRKTSREVTFYIKVTEDTIGKTKEE